MAITRLLTLSTILIYVVAGVSALPRFAASLDRGGIAVASLGSGSLFSSSIDASSGDVKVSAVPNTKNVVLLDCAGSDVYSRDVRVAVAVATIVVCEVTYSDLLLGGGRLSALQCAVEGALVRHASGPRGAKKQLHVICMDCTGDTDEVKEALKSLVNSAWAAADKPDGCEGVSLSDILDIHMHTLPNREEAAEKFKDEYVAFINEIEAGGNDLSAAQLSEQLEAATTAVQSVRHSETAPSHADAIANAMCNAHVERVLRDFLEGLPDLSEHLKEGFDNFGESCDESIREAVGAFEELAGGYVGTEIFRLKSKELEARVIEELEPIYMDQIKQLEELSWDRMRKRLVKLRLNDPSLVKEMELSVHDADAFFRDTAKRMVCQSSSWSADQSRREMVAEMRRFVTEKLQGARLQGAYVPGMQRRPVAVAMHYLAPKPFQILDALQDSLSYEEDMDWEPDFQGDDTQDGIVRKANQIPSGVSAMTSSWVKNAERKR